VFGRREAVALSEGAPALELAASRGLGLRLVLGLVVALAVALFALSRGAADIPVADIVRILVSHLPGVDVSGAWPESWDRIIWDIRLPRVLMAGLVGATLAFSGAAYQGVLRNPLADPYLIGVAAGAGLGATVIIVSPVPYSFGNLSLLPIFSFTGALIAVAVAYGLARSGGIVPNVTLILAGVAVSSIATSIMSYLMLANSTRAVAVLSWLLGGFNTSSWGKMWLLLPYAAPAAVVILMHGRILNVLQLGEEEAQQLGVRVERVKLLVMAAASLATAAAVSVSGLIGFVGLIVPHATRLLWGPDYRRLIPLAMTLGAAFLILADLLARTLLEPTEIPVGIITALCGAPFFLWLLRRQRRVVF
jgi:iron complex transport system permease protein